MTLGERLKKLREEKNITTRELAGIFKLGKSTISNYENDVRKPDYDMLIKFADYYDVSVDYLLGRTPNRAVNILTQEQLKMFTADDKLEEVGISKAVTSNEEIAALLKQALEKLTSDRT